MTWSIFSQRVRLVGEDRISQPIVTSVLPPDRKWRAKSGVVGDAETQEVLLEEESAWTSHGLLRLWVRLMQREDQPGVAVLSVDVSSRLADFDEEKGGVISGALGFALAAVGAAFIAWVVSSHVDTASVRGKVAIGVSAVVAAGVSWVWGTGILINILELPVRLSSRRVKEQLKADVIARLAQSSILKNAEAR